MTPHSVYRFFLFVFLSICGRWLTDPSYYNTVLFCYIYAYKFPPKFSLWFIEKAYLLHFYSLNEWLCFQPQAISDFQCLFSCCKIWFMCKKMYFLHIFMEWLAHNKFKKFRLFFFFYIIVNFSCYAAEQTKRSREHLLFVINGVMRSS